MIETIQNIVRIGDDYEIKIPLKTWKTIDAKPGDFVHFYNETGAEGDGLDDYEYIKIIKHPTSTLEIPTKDCHKLQEMIDKKKIPFKTIEEVIIHAIEKLIRESKIKK